MKSNKTILICPLNWGLGHASRDIPIIRRLKAMGYQVVVATESPLKELIDEAVPGLTFEEFPGPKITYTKSAYLIPTLIGQIPCWIKWLRKEKKVIKRLVQKYQPVAILSDNRYGARHPKVRSILITHQLMVKLPLPLKWAEGMGHRLIHWLIRPFDDCWIPDFNRADSLAGDLVHLYPLPANARLIGPLSRFMDPTPPLESNPLNYQCLAILSGPEPQKTILKNLLITNLAKLPVKSLIITGEPDTQPGNKLQKEKTVTLIPHLNQNKLGQLILHTPVIIARSGYSTLMDLYFLNKKALLIPTPGQTEQTYLALHHAKNHIFVFQNKTFSIESEKTAPLLTGPISQKQPVNQILQAALDTLAKD
jgi:hypothetical protein